MNAQTDTALEAAKTSGALDSTMKTTFQDSLLQYQQSLQTAYKASENANTQALLQTFFNEAALLIEQSKH